MAAGSLWVRWVHATGVVRQQIKWFTYAAAVLASGVILTYVISELMGLVWLGWFGDVLTLVGLAGIPISTGIAITRYRLYEIDLVIPDTAPKGKQAD